MKGSLVAAYSVDMFVYLVFSSPTGDSSDSHQFCMPCHNEEQARIIADHHRTVWGIPNYGDENAEISSYEKTFRTMVKIGLGYDL